MKRLLALLLVLSAVLALAACSKTPAVTEDEGTTLVYGSGDYTRINPAMDEHGEINVLLFSGLTAHNGATRSLPVWLNRGNTMRAPAPTPSTCATA